MNSRSAGWCACTTGSTLLLFVLLAGCGGDGASQGQASSDEPATIRTLAYTVFECRQDANGLTARQSLRIRRGDREPVTVAQASTIEPIADPFLSFGGACRLLGLSRHGPSSQTGSVFQRLGVSRDGSGVVFEVTNEFSIFPAIQLIPLEQGLSFPGAPQVPGETGFFYVRSDGTGLRRIGPASREPSFRLVLDPSLPTGFNAIVFSFLGFSPDSTTITYTDRGPGLAGEEAVQIFTLDIASGRRTQLTHLPPANNPDPGDLPVVYPAFLNAQTIIFWTFANPNGLNPEGRLTTLRVNIPTLTLTLQPSPVVLPGSQIIPIYSITGGLLNTVTFAVPGVPVNHVGGYRDQVAEVFLSDGDNLLQLTNFGRVDTFDFFVGHERVLFAASADPFGTNPSENCQIFSVDKLGADLRQLTRFSEAAQSVAGCGFGYPHPRGCSVGSDSQDPVTGTVLFYSSCDPSGMNPNGGQIFAMRQDGTGLRALTDTRGFITDADGVVEVELPGQFAQPVIG